MNHKLIPRLTTEQAGSRLTEIEQRLADGAKGHELVRVDMGSATLNPTGGEAPTSSDLQAWRQAVIERMKGARTGTKTENDRHGARLGQAIADCINPSPSDAAHDGVWAYLSLWMFPDLVLQRWGSSPEALSVDRWIGSPLGRDRNYLKTSWRRWQLLGDILWEGSTPLGEDEFGGLLERTSMARNKDLLRAAARQVLMYSGSFGRMEFTRLYMKELTYLSGPLHLDTLTNEELQALAASSGPSGPHPERATASHAHRGSLNEVRSQM